jgi:hypothetical protein
MNGLTDLLICPSYVLSRKDMAETRVSQVPGVGTTSASTDRHALGIDEYTSMKAFSDPQLRDIQVYQISRDMGYLLYMFPGHVN